MKLSVIIPVYNEEKTILEIIKQIDAVELDKELIIVDDGSTDRTRELLAELQQSGRLDLVVILHEKNQGKGGAIRTGLRAVTGEVVIIQDADLEYDPQDYLKLIEPIQLGKAQVVYGARKLPTNLKGRKFHDYGVIFLTKLANLLYGINITDEATCYKLFSTEVIKNINLKCEHFEFCPEVTAKVAKQKLLIMEVPITYLPRDAEGGKKLRLRDGFEAITTLIKYRFID